MPASTLERLPCGAGTERIYPWRDHIGDSWKGTPQASYTPPGNLGVHAGEGVKPICSLSSDVRDAGKITTDRIANFIAICRYLVR